MKSAWRRAKKKERIQRGETTRRKDCTHINGDGGAEEGEDGEVFIPSAEHVGVKFPDGEVHVLEFNGDKPSESFMHKFSKFMQDWKKESLVFYFFNKAGKKILPQYWPFRELDNTQHGPIQLNKSEGVPAGLQNWTGNQHYVPSREYLPRCVDDAKDALREAYQNGESVTVIGGAFSSSNLGSTRGVLINTRHLHHVQLNYNDAGDVVSATVESGTPIIELVQKLSDKNKVLPTSPIFAQMTMGGGLAVGIHGTGRDVHPLPDYITHVRVLNINMAGDVEDKTYNVEENPDEMRALNVNLGAMGFVYSTTVKVCDRFNLKAVDEHVDFPATREEFIAFVEDLVLSNEHVELFWWPTTAKLWVKKWNRTHEAPTPNFKQKLADVQQYIESYAAYPLVQFLTSFPRWTPYVLQAMMDLSLPGGHAEVVAPANYIYNYLLALPSKQWDMNQCLNCPNVGAGNDFAALVDTYIGIREMVQEQAKKKLYPLNTTLHTRFITNSNAFMSPVYGNDISAMTEVLSWSTTSDWAPFFKNAEKMWLQKGGRPHWGKCIFQLPERSAWGGGEGVERFLEVKERLDPHSVFLNDFQYDVFKRKIPKMATVVINSIHVHESLFPKAIHVMHSLFHKAHHEYTIKIVTATDARETIPVTSSVGKDTIIDQTFHNVALSNFITFQLWIDGHIASTAVWHAPLYDIHDGVTQPHEICLQPNWNTPTKLGCINFDVTPVNVPGNINARDIKESVAIIGTCNNDSPDEALVISPVITDFVRLSAAAGYKVYVNEDLGAFGEDELKINVGSVKSIVREATIVVFACAPEDAKAFIKDGADLAHKVIVDATSYFASGADDVHHDGADHMGYKNGGESVAFIDEIEDQNDGSQIYIRARNPGVTQAVVAWINSMNLTPHVV